MRPPALIALLCALVGAAGGAAAADASDGGRKIAGAHVLFDAGRDDPSAFRHYTASWRKGSDLVPVAAPVEKDGQRFLDIHYTGERGVRPDRKDRGSLQR